MLERISLPFFKCVAVFLIAFVTAWVIPEFWNRVVPQITGWREITYWQAYWLYVLIWVLTPPNFSDWEKNDDN